LRRNEQTTVTFLLLSPLFPAQLTSIWHLLWGHLHVVLFIVCQMQINVNGVRRKFPLFGDTFEDM